MLPRPPALRCRLPFLRLSYLRDLCALLLLCGSFSSDSRKISAQKIAKITKIWDPENCCFVLNRRFSIEGDYTILGPLTVGTMRSEMMREPRRYEVNRSSHASSVANTLAKNWSSSLTIVAASRSCGSVIVYRVMSVPSTVAIN